MRWIGVGLVAMIFALSAGAPIWQMSLADTGPAGGSSRESSQPDDVTFATEMEAFRAAARAGEFDRAERIIAEIERRGGRLETLSLLRSELAAALTASRQLQRARAILKQVDSAGPMLGIYYSASCFLAFMERSFDLVMRDCHDSIARGGNIAGAHLFLSIAHIWRDDFDAAEREVNIASQLFEANIMQMHALSISVLVHLAKDRPIEAVSDLLILLGRSEAESDNNGVAARALAALLLKGLCSRPLPGCGSAPDDLIAAAIGVDKMPRWIRDVLNDNHGYEEKVVAWINGGKAFRRPDISDECSDLGAAIVYHKLRGGQFSKAADIKRAITSHCADGTRSTQFFWPLMVEKLL